MQLSEKRKISQNENPNYIYEEYVLETYKDWLKTITFCFSDEVGEKVKVTEGLMVQ